MSDLLSSFSITLSEYSGRSTAHGLYYILERDPPGGSISRTFWLAAVGTLIVLNILGVFQVCVIFCLSSDSTNAFRIAA